MPERPSAVEVVEGGGGEINGAMPSDQSGDGSSIGVVCLYLWWLTHTLLDQ